MRSCLSCIAVRLVKLSAGTLIRSYPTNRMSSRGTFALVCLIASACLAHGIKLKIQPGGTECIHEEISHEHFTVGARIYILSTRVQYIAAHEWRSVCRRRAGLHMICCRSAVCVIDDEPAQRPSIHPSIHACMHADRGSKSGWPRVGLGHIAVLLAFPHD